MVKKKLIQIFASFMMGFLKDMEFKVFNSLFLIAKTLNQKIFSDIRADLNKNLDKNFSLIQSPTLILWGKKDRVIHVENIHKYASLISNSKPASLSN